MPSKHGGLSVQLRTRWEDSSGRETSRYLGKCFPPSFPLWAVETVLLQHAGARCQGCFWLGVADAARPVAPGSPGPPRGLRGSVLHSTLPLPATSFGELGTGKKRARTTEVQFCGVTPKTQLLVAYVVGTYFPSSLCSHLVIRN